MGSGARMLKEVIRFPRFAIPHATRIPGLSDCPFYHSVAHRSFYMFYFLALFESRFLSSSVYRGIRALSPCDKITFSSCFF